MKVKKDQLFRCCECGCGGVLPSLSSQKFSSNACRQRNHRRRHGANQEPNCNTKNLDARYAHRGKRNADGEICCVVLFDQKHRPLELIFARMEGAKSYVHDCSWKKMGGNYFEIFKEIGG